MLHFLAKLGRKKWAPRVLPTVIVGVTSGYMLFHMFGHKTFRNFFVARDNSGLNIELTDHVKSLILETYNENESKLYVEIFNLPGYKPPKSPIKWFASSTMEPVTIGLTETRSGIIVGLPFFFNNTKTMDVPDYMIRFKKLRFFKKFRSDPEGDKINQGLDRTKFNMNQDLIPPWESAIDRKDPDVKAYLESMILSDNAIKFAIARELFVGDSYRPLLKSGVMFISTMLPLVMARTAVIKLNLRPLHIARRFPIYGLAAIYGIYQYMVLTGAIERMYTEKCDKSAMESGETYRLGAIEYLEKMRQRNKALHRLFADAREVFTPDGDRIDGAIVNRYVPIDDRLLWATELGELNEKLVKEREDSKDQVPDA